MSSTGSPRAQKRIKSSPHILQGTFPSHSLRFHTINSNHGILDRLATLAEAELCEMPPPPPIKLTITTEHAKKVLAGLLTLVLIYALGVLAYSRHAVKKYAAAEARQKADQDAEAHPMLADLIEVPFGARALEKGIQVEGIWPSKDYSQASHSPNIQKAAVEDVRRPSQAHKVIKTSRIILSSQRSPWGVDTGPVAHSLESPNFENNPFSTLTEQGTFENNTFKNHIMADQNSQSSTWAGPRNSWTSDPFENAKNQPRTKGKLGTQR